MSESFEATKRISVGIKQLSSDPYDNLEKKYKVGDVVSGTVTRNLEYGSFVRLSEGLEGLVHSSELDWTKKILIQAKYSLHPKR